MDAHLPATDHLAASARLRALAERVAGPEAARVSVGEMVDTLGDTGLGLTLLLLMLPVFITIPGLPVGIFFGFLVALLGVQIARGADRLHLPAGIRARTLAAGQVRHVLLAALPWLERAERWLRGGRLAGLTSPPARRLLGLVLVVQGLALAVPLPFGNHPPALAVVAIGLGLMERDGAAIALGLVLSVLGVAWNLLLIFASAELLAWAAGWLGW
ncbi:MAG: exopolysaccharide biosynthesis protein [Alphaproteobacteria bacterium]|nr:exopolysaccharide biosynthesis protein [Alphaproteobacteria bacterium]